MSVSGKNNHGYSRRSSTESGSSNGSTNNTDSRRVQSSNSNRSRIVSAGTNAPQNKENPVDNRKKSYKQVQRNKTVQNIRQKNRAHKNTRPAQSELSESVNPSNPKLEAKRQAGRKKIEQKYNSVKKNGKDLKKTSAYKTARKRGNRLDSSESRIGKEKGTRRSAKGAVTDDNKIKLTGPNNELKTEIAKSKVESAHKIKVSTGITTATGVGEKVFNAGADSSESGSYYSSGMKFLSRTPATAVNASNLAAEVNDSAKIAKMTAKETKKTYETAKKMGYTKKQSRQIANRHIEKQNRIANYNKVQRYNAAQKGGSVKDVRKVNAAKKRAISNIQNRKKTDSLFKIWRTKGAVVAKEALKKRISVGMGALLAPIFPFLLGIIAAVLAVVIFLAAVLSMMELEFHGWYSEDSQPSRNIYEAMTELNNLYARDIRTYCIYNNVPMPEKCDPQWGRTLALWSVLAQNYFGATSVFGSLATNIGGTSSIPITFQNVAGSVTGSRYYDVNNYSGVMLLSAIDTVNHEIECQPGLMELLYFSFRVIHYDMIGVDEDENNNYEVSRSEEWGARISRNRFERGLPRMWTSEGEVQNHTTEVWETVEGTGFELRNYTGERDECEICDGASYDPNAHYSDDPVINAQMRQEAERAYNARMSIVHTHYINMGEQTFSNRDIVTLTQPLTAQEALDIIHTVSCGGSVDVNGQSYPPSYTVQTYCEDLMVRNFRRTTFTGLPRLSNVALYALTGAGFCVGPGGNILSCSACTREQGQGCLYDHCRSMLDQLWVPGDMNTMRWYHEVDGNWEITTAGSGKPDEIYCVGLLPDLASFYGPAGMITDASEEQEFINQVCQAIFDSGDGSALREVWVNHLIYMGVNCSVYDGSLDNRNDTQYGYLQSLGINPEDYYSDWLDFDNSTFCMANNPNAFVHFNASTQSGGAAPALDEVWDWLEIGIPADYDYIMANYPMSVTIMDNGFNNWIAPGYQGPIGGALENYNYHWCAWFVCYLANTNGLVECFETGKQYHSYYNLLSHHPSAVDSGEGYFVNDAALNRTCQYMLRAFYDESRNGGSCTCIFPAITRDDSGQQIIDPNAFDNLKPGDILFIGSNATGSNDHRTSDERDPYSPNHMPETNHVCVAIGVVGDHVITLEGNCGDRVAVQSRSLTNTGTNRIIAYVDLFSTQSIGGQ